MSNNTQKNNEEELDLGSLFVVIGKGFSKLFRFIGGLFSGLFDFLIRILLFLKNNVIKIGIAILIGGVLGSFLEFNRETKYEANLQVQPNFNSARQLYNNIGFYNDLVKQKDTLMLAKVFKITVSEANSLKRFEIDAVRNENDIIAAYDNLITSVDTLTAKSYSFDKYREMFTIYDYKIQNISVQATKNDIFAKLSGIIINAITENDYFQKVKELKNNSLTTSSSLIKKSLKQSDSLHNIYKKVMIEEAKKAKSGTNIDLGGTKQSSKELELFTTNKQLNNDLKRVNEEISEKSEIINVISNFQPIGHRMKSIEKNYGFLGAMLGATLMILFLLLLQLNRYLENYKK